MEFERLMVRIRPDLIILYRAMMWPFLCLAQWSYYPEPEGWSLRSNGSVEADVRLSRMRSFYKFILANIKF